MRTEKYSGYTLWGHAILQQEDILQVERFVASGTIMRDTKVVGFRCSRHIRNGKGRGNRGSSMGARVGR
jgi:hypothetical protein